MSTDPSLQQRLTDLEFLLAHLQHDVEQLNAVILAQQKELDVLRRQCGRLEDRLNLWGGEPETVAETIRVGVNSTHPDTRASEMIAFGAGGILDPTQVANVADYVMSLPGVVELR